MPKESRICKQCGKTFERWPSIKSVFCSMSCSTKYARASGKPRKPRRGETNPCLVCGKPVYRPKAVAERGRGVVCSRACNVVYQTKPPVIKSCPHCGKEMRLKPSQAGRIHCSKRCDTLASIKRPLDRMHNGRRAKLSNGGYVMIWEPEHPNKAFHGWQYEHRMVAEQAIGRLLTSDEHVHHINGVKDDNHPDNLAVLSAAQHSVITVRENSERIAREREELARFRELYGPLPTDE